MTPERLNELADWLVNSNAEEIADDIDNVQEIAAFLRECATCEPVYQKIFHGYQWIDCDKAAYDRDNGLKKRILYTAPQPIKESDTYCLTQANGECVSTDPRCMHNLNEVK